MEPDRDIIMAVDVLSVKLKIIELGGRGVQVKNNFESSKKCWQ